MNDAVEMLERDLRALSTTLTAPRAGECLLCYVRRMLVAHGCSGLHWATYYRDRTAPAATALEPRLAERGAFCDCEIFLNGYRCVLDVDDEADETSAPPDPFPPCVHVRRGSTQPCELWTPRRRGGRW